MDIAGFAGFAERGPLPPAVTGELFDPLTVAVRVTGWDEYRGIFGGFTDRGYLPFAVRAFFENGGSECYVVRVAATTAVDPEDQPQTSFFPIPGEAAATPIALTAAATKGSLTVKAAPSTATTLDLLGFHSHGLDEYIPVAWTLADGTIRLARPLQTDYPTATQVTKYTRAFLISAASAGNWGDRISIKIDVLDIGANVKLFAMRLKVAPGIDLTAPEEEEYYPQLSLDPVNKFYAPTVVNAASKLIRIDTSGTVSAKGVLTSITADRIWLTGGRDGLAKVTNRDLTGAPGDFRGITVFERIDTIGILCAPDAVWAGAPKLPPPPPPPPPDPCSKQITADSTAPPDPDPTAMPPGMDTGLVYQTLIGQCFLKRYRTCILDIPDAIAPSKARTWASDNQLVSAAAKFAALYYPWIKVPDPLSPFETTRRVPAAGHVAGAYAFNDHTSGVQKPPANIQLSFAVDVTVPVDDLAQGPLNEAAVDVIRAIPGRGIRVFGARALAAIASGQSDWTFIHIRRLMSAIEATIERSMQWAVFQNNDATLRRTLVHSITVLLQGVFDLGGLKGSTPAQSFYVKCDATNNPPSVVDAGQIIVQVGVAVAAAMEFLAFELRQDVEGSQLSEG